MDDFEKEIRFHTEGRQRQLITVGVGLGRLLFTGEAAAIFKDQGATLRSTSKINEFFVIPPINRDKRRIAGKALENLANSLDHTPPPAKYKP